MKVDNPKQCELLVLRLGPGWAWVKAKLKVSVSGVLSFVYFSLHKQRKVNPRGSGNIKNNGEEIINIIEQEVKKKC